jgi:protein subunit release factor B
MYQGWAERRGYELAQVAESTAPPRVVLRISGPGARGFLAGEVGLHRRVEEGSRVGAYVRLHPWPAPAGAAQAAIARDIRRQSGFFLPKIGAEAEAHEESSGRAVALKGSGNLAELADVAWTLVASGRSVSAEVRRYVLGRAAHVEDPRTGVSTPRVKDVLRGELELFIAAWMSRGADDPGEPGVG